MEIEKRNVTMIEFKIEVFNWLRREIGKPEKDAFSSEIIEQIGKHMAEIIDSCLKLNVDITLKHSKASPNLFYIMQKYLGQNFLDKYLDKILNDDPSGIIRILDVFTPTAGNLETDIPRQTDFERNQYNNVTKLLKPESIITAIANYMGELPKIDTNFPSKNRQKNRTVLLNQFLWLHEYVLKEASDNIKESEE